MPSWEVSIDAEVATFDADRMVEEGDGSLTFYTEVEPGEVGSLPGDSEKKTARVRPGVWRWWSEL